MQDNVKVIKNIYIKNELVKNLGLAYNIESKKFDEDRAGFPTQDSKYDHIKDHFYKLMFDSFSSRERYSIEFKPRGSKNHMIIHDKEEECLYAVISKERYRDIKREAVDPYIPAHYLFIYSQKNPGTSEQGYVKTLFDIEEVELGYDFILKKEHAKAESKKYLKDKKVKKFILVVFDFDKLTNSLLSINAFVPSNQNLEPVSGIEILKTEKPIFSFTIDNTKERVKGEEDSELIMGLRPEVQKKLDEEERRKYPITNEEDKEENLNEDK